MDLADAVIDRLENQDIEDGLVQSKLTVEDYPARIFRLHPSIFQKDGRVFCGRIHITPNRKLLLSLLDMPDASLSASACEWLFNRIKELAPQIDERYIVISDEYVWDRKTAQMVPIDVFPNLISTNNESTLRRKND